MKIKIGQMPCPDEDCESHANNRPVYLRLNDENGVISYQCDDCHGKDYAKPGEPRHAHWVKRGCKGNEEQIDAAVKRGIYKKYAKGPAPAAPEKPAAPPAPAAPAKPEKSTGGGLWNR